MVKANPSLSTTSKQTKKPLKPRDNLLANLHINYCLLPLPLWLIALNKDCDPTHSSLDCLIDRRRPETLPATL